MRVMTKLILCCVVWLCVAAGLPGADGVLIVADEFPAMEVLAAKLKADEGMTSRIVAQTNLPAALDSFAAVVVYIHRGLAETAEKAFIDYAQAGGKLVVLHHSISSGKRQNRHWFGFLGVALPAGDVERGGYKWIEPVTLELVNLAPQHPIMSRKVRYPSSIAYRRAERGDGEQLLPGFVLKETEVYLNHVLTDRRSILMGFKYSDANSGKIYLQEHAGWCKPAGKGHLVYLLPGHSKSDFEDPCYAQIVVNAITWKP